MGFLRNLSQSKTDSQVRESNSNIQTAEDIRNRMYADQPDVLASFSEQAKQNEPGLLSKGWSALGTGVKAPFKALGKLGRSSRNYTQKVTKELLLPEHTGMIDPKLYKNLAERGDFDKIKELRGYGLSTPELVEKPILDRLSEEKKELYTGNMIKDLIDTGQTEEDIMQSVVENRFNKNLEQKYPDFEKLASNNQEAIYDKLIEEMTLSPQGGMTFDEITEIATHNSPKRSELYGEMPGYVFATNALRDFTSGWIDFSVAPETTKERVVGVLGNIAGIVGSLALTGKALQGAVNYIGGTTKAIQAAKGIKDVTKAAKAIQVAKNASFFGKYPKLAPLLKEIGAFNIHGQLSPELSDDMSDRLKQASMDTAMAVGMWGMNTTFAKLGAASKGLRAGDVGISPVWQYGGIPANAALFGTLSALNGDSMEEIITNAAVGGAFGGMGLLKKSGYYAITLGEARSKLTKASKLRLDKNYKDSKVEQIRLAAGKKLENEYKNKGLFNKRTPDAKKAKLAQEYGKKLSTLDVAREILIKAPKENRDFKNPTNVFKETIKEIKTELNMMIGRKGKVKDVKIRPSKLEEQAVETRPGEPIVSKDGKGIVVGDVVFELGKDTVNEIVTNGKVGFENRINLLEKQLAVTKDIKLRKNIIDRIETLEGIGHKMGFIGKRITDVKSERPTVEISVPKTLKGIKGLTSFSIEKVVKGLVSKIKGIKVPTEKSIIIEKAIKAEFPKATPKEIARLKRVIGKALKSSADVENLPQIIKEAIEAEKKVKAKPKAKERAVPERKKITEKEKEKAITEIKKDETEIKEVYKKGGKKVEKALYEVFTLLDLAEAGKRDVAKPGAKDIYSIEDVRLDKKSTFPKWIPSELRNRKLINKVINQVFDIKNIKFPSGRGIKVRELYNAILNEIDLRADVNTAPMRNRIIQNYDKIYKGKFTEEIKFKGKAPKDVRGGVKGREGKEGVDVKAIFGEDTLTKSTKLFHGSEDGKLKVDERGNINLGLSEKDISKFGKSMPIETNKLNIKTYESKSDIFDVAASNKKKQALIKNGIDTIFAENHGIIIDPVKVSKRLGLETTKGVKDITVGEKVKQNKPLIGEKVNYIGRVYIIKDYNKKGEIELTDSSGESSWQNVDRTYKDMGGKKDVYVLRGKAVDTLRHANTFLDLKKTFPSVKESIEAMKDYRKNKLPAYEKMTDEAIKKEAEAQFKSRKFFRKDFNDAFPKTKVKPKVEEPIVFDGSKRTEKFLQGKVDEGKIQIEGMKPKSKTIEIKIKESDGKYFVVNKETNKKISNEYNNKKAVLAFELGFKTARKKTSIEKPLKIKTDKGIFLVVGDKDIVLSRSMRAETAGAYIEGHQKGVTSLRLDKFIGVETKIPKSLESVTNQAKNMSMSKFVDTATISKSELAAVIKNNKDNKIPDTKSGDEFIIGQLESFWRTANGKEITLDSEVPGFGDMNEIARLKKEAKRPRFGEIFKKPTKKIEKTPITLRKQEGFYLPPNEFSETNLFKQIEGKPIGVEKSLMIKETKVPKLYEKTTDAFIKKEPEITNGLTKETVYRLYVKPTIDRYKAIKKQKSKDTGVLFSEISKTKTMDEMVDVIKNNGVKEIEPPKVSKKNLTDREAIDEYKGDKISEEIEVSDRLTLSEASKKQWDRFMNAWVDKYNDITKVYDLVVKEGADITPENNPIYAIKKMFGIKSVSDIQLDHFTFALTPGTKPGWVKTGKGLSEIIRPFKKVAGDLKVLLFAQRDIELSGRIGKGEIKGTDMKRSQDIIKKLKKIHGEEGFKKLENGAQEVRDWAKRALFDPLYAEGVINRETYDKILESNQLYIPFFRVMDSLKNNKKIKKDADLFSSKSVPLKRIFGSDKKIIDPIESLIGNLYALNSWLAKERVKNNLVNLRKYNKEIAENEIVEIERPKMTKVAMVEKTAEIDQLFMDTLKDYSEKLGGRFITKGKVTSKLGTFYTKSKVIVRKFATSPKTAVHEFGHLIDVTFGLSDIFNAKTKVGKEIYKFAKEKFEESEARLNKPEEVFADAFSWWLTQRFEAQTDIPLFSKEIVKVLKANPELKGILEIKQNPKSSIERTMEDVFRPSMFQDKDVIDVYSNGKKKYYRLSEGLANAIKVLDDKATSDLINIIGIPARLLRAGATLSPDFMIRNPFRDQFQAGIHSKFAYKPFVDLAAGMYNMFMNTDVYKEFKMSGAEHSMLVSIDRLANRRTYDKLMGQTKKQLGIEYMKHPLDVLRALSEVGEKGTRLGEFRLARKKGATLEEAANAARDITIDFKRMGNIGGQMNKIVAFWNANIQDIDKLRRSWKERPVRSTMNALLGLTLPSIGFFMMNKDDPLYWELPRWRRDLFWNIPIKGDKVKFVSLPKPFLLGATFATSVEHVLEYVYKKDPDALTSFPKFFFSTMTPGWLPTAFIPPIEYAANYSFFRKRPVVSESIQDLPSELQSASYTTETAKKLGMLFKVSPAKLENSFYGYTAGLGRYGLQISDFLIEKIGITDLAEKPTKSLGDIPIVRAFIPREPSGSGSESVNRFYKILTEARETDEAIDLFIKSGEAEKAEKYRDKNPNYVYLKGLEEVARDFSKLRKRINAVYVSDEITADEKRETIDSLNRMMTEMANQAVEFIKASSE